MGYTTEFTGAVQLSRKLTLKEAQFLLEMNDDCDVTQERFGMRNYLQWVPTTSLDQIVWDGNEKFYDYRPLLIKVCDWLKQQGVQANGELYWQGEERGDIGTIFVRDCNVEAIEGEKFKIKAGQPLTMDALGLLALDSLK